MGYTTDFTGAFALSRALTPAEAAYFETRPDPLRIAATAACSTSIPVIRLTVEVPCDAAQAIEDATLAVGGKMISEGEL